MTSHEEGVRHSVTKGHKCETETIKNCPLSSDVIYEWSLEVDTNGRNVNFTASIMQCM